MRALAAVARVLAAGGMGDSLDPHEAGFIRLFIRDSERFLEGESDRRHRLAEVEEEHGL